MAKRKKMDKSSKGKTITKSKPSLLSLLSLPPEIRNMIWKLVFKTDIVHLFPRCYFPLDYVSRIGASSLSSTSPMPGLCSTFHKHDHPRQLQYAVNSKSGPGSLSWPRTNRQIYTESKSFVQGNLTFHLCNAMVFSSLSLQQKAILSLSTCRSLSLCLKIRIESDYRDGFTFSRTAGMHGWGGVQWDNYSLRAGKKEANHILSALRDLKLHLFFNCKQAQGPRLGQLYRPKDPAKLVCVDSQRKVEDFINTFCGVTPLQVLRTAKLEDVSVQFQTREMEHYTVPSVVDRCWCIGRSVDEANLRKIKLGERIEQKLLDLSKKETGA